MCVACDELATQGVLHLLSWTEHQVYTRMDKQV